MQSIVVDAEVVGQLVDHGDHHLLAEHLQIVAGVAQREAVERDAIRQLEPAVVLPLGSRDAFIQTEEGLVGVLVVDHDDDVVEQFVQFVRQSVDGIDDETLEGVVVDRVHGTSVPRWEPLRTPE